jgi:drug/metabolite transporter (DMT)-like permease
LSPSRPAQPATHSGEAAAGRLSGRRPAQPATYFSAEIGLVGIAAVWGLTFVMVQDAIERLPAMAFLAYRFVPAGAIVAAVFWRSLRRLPPAGWRAGLVMAVFLTGGYVAQTLGLEHTTASNAGFITGLFVVLTPLLGAVLFGIRPARAAWLAAFVSALGLLLLSGASGRFVLEGDGVVFLCACAFALHILVTARAVERFDVGALVAVQLSVCGLFCLAVAALGGDLEAPRGGSVWSALIVTSLVASALGFVVQSYAQQHAPPARTALILAAEPAFAGLFGYLLQDDRLSAVAWTGAALILAAIVLVDVVPRLRPPRPLPEG